VLARLTLSDLFSPHVNVVGLAHNDDLDSLFHTSRSIKRELEGLQVVVFKMCVLHVSEKKVHQTLSKRFSLRITMTRFVPTPHES
jgi:hypothetical protein